MAKTERRVGTSTEGSGLGHSFADDNVARGDSDAQFIKRRPTYTWGDNPRGREIDWIDQDTKTFRSYKGLVPIEGQDPFAPKRIIRVGSTQSLRPELPPRTVDTAALDAAKEAERVTLLATDFQALFPSVLVVSPTAGAVFARGSTITIQAEGSDIRSLFSATLFIDNTPTERRTLDRRDQDSTKNHTFTFKYVVPPDRSLGTMDITVRVYNVATAAQGVILDDAINIEGTFRGAVGSQDGRIKHTGATYKTSPKLEVDPNQYLRTPEGVSSLVVNII